ncbi:hypothetical protein NY65_20645 [Xanthomonas phaseoli pv. phaseoli]|nr:hypothetical protein NY65_20645 [Xanthomonas phaseoli pv. phaseoli]KGP22270.1 hypothetical protein NY68_20020 [Xanthomonas citri pv. fuscans]KGP23498.1 hypothetical protein NY67_17560 [Xanthomonas citri pv. fuscans]KGP33666.1 hypothetical protein NY64_19590 [Xanthomonas citri pv. fuscans]
MALLKVHAGNGAAALQILLVEDGGISIPAHDNLAVILVLGHEHYVDAMESIAALPPLIGCQVA